MGCLWPYYAFHLWMWGATKVYIKRSTLARPHVVSGIKDNKLSSHLQTNRLSYQYSTCRKRKRHPMPFLHPRRKVPRHARRCLVGSMTTHLIVLDHGLRTILGSGTRITVLFGMKIGGGRLSIPMTVQCGNKICLIFFGQCHSYSPTMH